MITIILEVFWFNFGLRLFVRLNELKLTELSARLSTLLFFYFLASNSVGICPIHLSQSDLTVSSVNQSSRCYQNEKLFLS